MLVVASDAHRRHAPRHEVHLGQPIPTYEVPDRAERIRAALRADGGFDELAPQPHGVDAVEAVHHPGLARFLERAWRELHEAYPDRDEFHPEVVLHAGLRAGMGAAPEPPDAEAAFGYWCYETATPLVEGTYLAARESVDIAISATDLVLGGRGPAYGLCRPPGHHAATSTYGGFCFFNNAAIAAQHARAGGAARVTVLDVDYHHGNGTQQIFYERPDVQLVSLHGDPARAYPWFTGHADETGAGAGLGTTTNVPLAPGVDDDAYVRHLSLALEAVDRFSPDLLVVSLGVDTSWNDPISDLALTPAGFERCGRLVAELGRPTVVLQEGGYDIEEIGENVRRWLVGLRDG